MDQILQIISKRLGLRVGDKEAARWRDMLTERSRKLTHGSLPVYAQFLLRGGRESEQEWEELASLLTTGETYFFRDNAQIALLKTRLLPDLIEQRRGSRELRIWSAGCSSGEEAYSIAMLLDDLLPLRRNWKITILGTDIDHRALSKAQNAVYTDWSFRNVTEETRQRFFQSGDHDWRLAPAIKHLASFQAMNLLTDSIPNAVANDMDLIICRNVFIYFEPQHVGSVFNKLVDTLRDGGYLLTGHGELHGVDTGRLQRHAFAESIVHQKKTIQHATPREPGKSVKTADFRTKDAPSASSNALLADASVDSHRSESAAWEEIEKLLGDGRPQVAIEQAKLLTQSERENVAVLMLLARAHADLGLHGQAVALCEQAIHQDALAVAPHYLLAKLAEAESNDADAKSHLKRVLYLDPTHAVAFFDLAELLDREGDAQQARKYRLAAIELLDSLPADEPIELRGAPSAGELREHLQRLVNDA